MKKISAFSMIILLASTAFAQSNFFKGTLDEALAKARTENKKVLFDFTSYT
jgi:hypothetical protein